MSDPKLDSLYSATRKLGGTRAVNDLSFDYCDLTYLEAEYLYSHNDLAARICELPVVESLSGKAWEFGGMYGEILEARKKELNLIPEVVDAAIMGRVSGDCFLYMAVDDGTADTEPLALTQVKRLKFVRRIERDKLSVATRYEDFRQKNFGEPRTYYIGARSHSVGSTQSEVHETRFVKFWGSRTTQTEYDKNGSWHDSSLKRLWPILKDFLFAWRNASSLLKNSVQGKYKVKDLLQILARPDGAKDLEDRMGVIDMARSVLQSLILDKEEDFTYEVAPLTSLPEMMDRYAARLSAASEGIPVTKLLGTSAAGMNATGEGDYKNWIQTLETYRRDHIQPQLEQLAQVILAEGNVIGSSRDIEIEFEELAVLSDLEEAQRRQVQAQTDTTYITAGVLLPEEVAASPQILDNYELLDDSTREVRVEEEAEAKKPELPPEFGGGEDDSEDRQDAFEEGKHPRAEDGKFGKGQARAKSAAKKAGKAAKENPSPKAEAAYKAARNRVRRARELTSNPNSFSGNRAANTSEDRKAALSSAKEAYQSAKTPAAKERALKDLRQARRAAGSSTTPEQKAARTSELKEAYSSVKDHPDPLRREAAHGTLVEHLAKTNDVEGLKAQVLEHAKLASVSDESLKASFASELEGKGPRAVAKASKAVAKDLVDQRAVAVISDAFETLGKAQNIEPKIYKAAAKSFASQVHDDLAKRVRKVAREEA